MLILDISLLHGQMSDRIMQNSWDYFNFNCFSHLKAYKYMLCKLVRTASKMMQPWAKECLMTWCCQPFFHSLLNDVSGWTTTVPVLEHLLYVANDTFNGIPQRQSDAPPQSGPKPFTVWTYGPLYDRFGKPKTSETSRVEDSSHKRVGVRRSEVNYHSHHCWLMIYIIDPISIGYMDD